MRLVIGTTNVPLENVAFAQTKQINDLFSLDTRQTNLTNTVKIPKTPQAVEAFEFLGIPGNESSRPYIKNDAYLYSDSGECYIYKGWAVIESTDAYYNVTIYDGTLDIYKAIEGYKLSDIPMPLLEHEKTPQTVVNSMQQQMKYRYMIADYGGKVDAALNIANIDFLVPFASVKYIWDCIFDYFGFTYEGTTFNTTKWTDLWLSYPKGTHNADPVFDEVIATNSAGYFVFSQDWIKFNASNVTTDSVDFLGDHRFVINEPGDYTIEISLNVDFLSLVPSVFELFMAKGNVMNVSEAVINRHLKTIYGFAGDQTSASRVINLTLAEGEIISFAMRGNNSAACAISNIDLKITRRENYVVNFQEAFGDWSVRDFFTEILWRFGLTPYKDKYKNHYVFYRLEELIKKSNVIDWSDKFVSSEKEIYLYSKYAQNNRFKYKYDDEGMTYYDGNIVVSNKNLEYETTLIQSKTFAPTQIQNGEDIWKMYDREIGSNGEISYKNLTNRFFFATSIRKTSTKNIVFISDSLLTVPATTKKYYVPSFKFQKFEYIVSEYYGCINNLLNNARVVTANMMLTPRDIIELDFTKPVYIEQLGGNFLINKVINFEETPGPTKVELIKVEVYTSTAKTPIFTIDTGATRLDCSDLASVVVNIDNIVGSVSFSGLSQGAAIERLSPGRFELTKIENMHNLSAIVFNTDGTQVVTNSIQLLKSKPQ